MKKALVLWGAAVLCYLLLIPPVEVAPPASADKHFTKQQQTLLEQARSYRDSGFWLAMARGGVTALLLLGAAFHFGHRIQKISSTSTIRSFALFFTILFWLLFAVCLPIDYVDGVVLEARWGFLRMSGWGWFWHHLKGALVSFGGGLIGAVLLGALLLKVRRWWLPAAAAAALLSLLTTLIAPVAISPLFSRFRPLQDEKLAQRLLAIAKKADIPAERVLVCDASTRYSHTNAYFIGLLSTRQIVLYDTLLEQHPPDEVEVIVAHEAGHARHHHIAKGLLLGVVVLFAFFATVAALVNLLKKRGLMEPHEPRVLAFIAFCGVVLMLLLAPFENYLSRRFEAQADLESLRLTQNPDAFIRAEKRLALHNLSPLNPPKLRYIWFATHPTPLERIGMAEAFKEGKIR